MNKKMNILREHANNQANKPLDKTFLVLFET